MTKITHLKVSNSVSFSTFINLYNHHFFRVLKHFHHHQRSPHTHKAGAFPTSPFPIPGNVSMNLPILDISCKWNHIFCDLSLQFSRSVRSDSLQPHGLQHTRLSCPSPTPRSYSNSCPLSWWCHPTVSSSVVPFSSCLQSFPVYYF